MKIFAAAMAALLLIIALLAGYLYFINIISEGLLSHTEAISAAAEEDDWETAQAELRGLLDKWEDAKLWMGIFIDHSEMDLINENLFGLKVYIKNENSDEALAKLSVLENLIRHIAENERPSLENILKRMSPDYLFFHNI